MCGGSLFCIPFLSQHVLRTKTNTYIRYLVHETSLFSISFYGLKNALLHLPKLNHGSYSSGSSSPSSPSPSLLSMSTGSGITNSSRLSNSSEFFLPSSPPVAMYAAFRFEAFILAVLICTATVGDLLNHFSLSLFSFSRCFERFVQYRQTFRQRRVCFKHLFNRRAFLCPRVLAFLQRRQLFRRRFIQILHRLVRLAGVQ